MQKFRKKIKAWTLKKAAWAYVYAWWRTGLVCTCECAYAGHNPWNTLCQEFRLNHGKRSTYIKSTTKSS